MINGYPTDPTKLDGISTQPFSELYHRHWGIRLPEYICDKTDRHFHKHQIDLAIQGLAASEPFHLGVPAVYICTRVGDDKIVDRGAKIIPNEESGNKICQRGNKHIDSNDNSIHLPRIWAIELEYLQCVKRDSNFPIVSEGTLPKILMSESDYFHLQKLSVKRDDLVDTSTISVTDLPASPKLYFLVTHRDVRVDGATIVVPRHETILYYRDFNEVIALAKRYLEIVEDSKKVAAAKQTALRDYRARVRT